MVLVCATCPLIGVGSLVTTYGAGMAVPDWPSTYGYNLFLYPWQTWISGPFDLFVEHGHRLFGALVGLLTIAFVVVAWYKDSRPWVKTMAIAALLLVILQGALGGARVLLNERFLALIHGATAPVFFAVCVSLAAVTSRYWRGMTELADNHKTRLQGVGRLAVITTALAYLQLILGAHVRHIPATASFAFFRAVVFAHLAMAAVLLLHVGMLTFRAARWRPPMAIRRLSLVLFLLLLSQMILGPAAWVMKYGWPDWVSTSLATPGYVVQAMDFGRGLVTTAHVVNGSLILAICLLMAIRSFRALNLADSSTRPKVRSEDIPSGALQMGVVV